MLALDSSVWESWVLQSVLSSVVCSEFCSLFWVPLGSGTYLV